MSTGTVNRWCPIGSQVHNKEVETERSHDS